MQPITMTIEDAVKVSGLARSRIYEMLGRGEIEAKKAGKRTLIVGDSLRNYVENLPPAVIRAPRQAA